jgi:hypothetical protein
LLIPLFVSWTEQYIYSYIALTCSVPRIVRLSCCVVWPQSLTDRTKHVHHGHVHKAPKGARRSRCYRRRRYCPISSNTQCIQKSRLTRDSGGLAGCVVAGRLAEADPSLSILVIEQGPNNYEVDQVVYPALYPRNLFPNSKYTLFWQGNHSPQLANRRPIVPSGGTLGGG